MYKIYTPNKLFKGERLGVHFENGVGFTNDATLARDLEAYGYTVEKEKVVRKKSEPK